MNKAVYKRLLATYGRSPGQWAGWVLEVASVFVVRIWAVIIIAQMTVLVASGDIDSAKQQVIIFAVGYSLGFLLHTVSSLIILRSGNTVYRHEGFAYYKKLTSKDMAFYRNSQTGYLVSMFRQYLDTMIVFARFIIQDLTPNIISLTAPVVILTVINWRVGLTALLVIVAQLLYVLWASSRAKGARLAAHEAYRKMTAEASDAITNIVAHKASGARKAAEARIAKYEKDETDAYWRRGKVITLYDFPRGIITVLGVSMAFYFAVSASASTPEAAGIMVLTITYMFQILRNIVELSNLLIKHDDFVSKIYPSLAYLSDQHETIHDPASSQKLSTQKLDVAFESVNFHYGDQQSEVFQNLSLVVAPGEQVGIVGLSGAGKSTLAGLLMRFDDVSAGAIRLGGVDIRDVTQDDLHQQIAYVPQEPLLFHRTIRENIAYFMDDVADERIIAAAKAAHAHEFILTLPNGYDSLVGERGIKLSGGQKQRIAIARAILKNSPIILFDEATSALDSESEAIIQRALPEILGERTAIIIAHRLSTVAHLDRIIVLEQGKIIEQGTHGELLRLGGRYAKLWQKQTKEKRS